VGPESVPGHRRAAVEVEDCDQCPQQGGGPIVKRLQVHPVEEFSPEKVDVRGLVLIGQRKTAFFD
jgi:hypothetical protein